jgi:hypothetical protein
MLEKHDPIKKNRTYPQPRCGHLCFPLGNILGSKKSCARNVGLSGSKGDGNGERTSGVPELCWNGLVVLVKDLAAFCSLICLMSSWEGTLHGAFKICDFSGKLIRSSPSKQAGSGRAIWIFSLPVSATFSWGTPTDSKGAPDGIQALRSM